MCVLPEHCA
jgi:hypothetical protein